MHLLHIKINRRENSYFVVSIKMHLMRCRKIDFYNDKRFLYTEVILQKYSIFRFRLRTIKSLKALSKISWYKRLPIIMTMNLAYYPIYWEVKETVQEADDRMYDVFDKDNILDCDEVFMRD